MAEAVGLASAIVALVGTATAIAKVITRLVDLREAPDCMLVLNNEISDLRIILAEIDRLKDTVCYLHCAVGHD